LPLGDVWGPDPVPKYKAVTGYARGYAYPFPEVALGVDVLICEGELDALVAQQELGHVVNVVSIGGAEQRPRPEALSALNGCPRWLVLPDNDEAGARALARWQALGGDRVVPMMLPGWAKDLTEFVRRGGDVRAWLAGAK
jgi:hypothetical protein